MHIKRNLLVFKSSSNSWRVFFYTALVATVVVVSVAIFMALNLGDMIASAHAPDLKITKTGNKEVIKAGESVQFTITLINVGDPDFVAGHNDSTAYDVKIIDKLPNGFTVTSSGNTTKTWELDKLEVGQTFQKSFKATASANIQPGGYLNVVTAKAKHKVNGVWVNYPQVQASFAIKVNAAPQNNPSLIIDKIANKSVLQSGEALQYTISVTNAGAGVAENLTLIDSLPGGFTVLSTGDSTITWTKSSLNPGQTWTNTFTAQSSSSVANGSYVNTATVSASNHGSVSDTATVVVNNPPTTPTNPVLIINKVANNTLILAGGQTVFTITVTNVGNGVANNLNLVDYLPVGFNVNGNSTITWTKSSLNPGQTWTNTFIAQSSSSLANGSYVNTATVSASNHGSVSDTATVVVNNPPTTPTNPVLTINKVANNASTNANSNVSYFVSVTNFGNATAINVTLTDILPSGFTHTTNSSNMRTWSLGNLVPNETKNVNYTAFVASGVVNGFYTNTATASASNHGSVSDTAIVQVTGSILGEQSDPKLVIEKTANRKTINPGGTVTYTITVKNFGDADAVSLTLKDVFPDYFSQVNTGLTSLTWTNPILAKNGGVWQVSYTAVVGNSAPQADYMNTATVWAGNHSGQVKDDYTVGVRKGTVLGDTGVGPLQILFWFSSALIFGVATYQIRKKYILAPGEQN